jgi:hypothetical protein
MACTALSKKKIKAHYCLFFLFFFLFKKQKEEKKKERKTAYDSNANACGVLIYGVLIPKHSLTIAIIMERMLRVIILACFCFV